MVLAKIKRIRQLLFVMLMNCSVVCLTVLGNSSRFTTGSIAFYLNIAIGLLFLISTWLIYFQLRKILQQDIQVSKDSNT